MEQSRKYTVDGIELNVPLYRDDFSGRILEDYNEWDTLDKFTPTGYLILTSMKEPCTDAEKTEPGRCIECAECRFYNRAAPHTWIGVCMNEKRLFVSRYDEYLESLKVPDL